MITVLGLGFVGLTTALDSAKRLKVLASMSTRNG